MYYNLKVCTRTRSQKRRIEYKQNCVLWLVCGLHGWCELEYDWFVARMAGVRLVWLVWVVWLVWLVWLVCGSYG